MFNTNTVTIVNAAGESETLYEPLPHQLAFHASTTPNLLGLGTRGTGKSVMLRWDAILRCLSVPNFHALIVRRTMPELRRSHLVFIDYEMAKLGGVFLHTVNTAKFPNGSTITFAHCYDDQTEVLTERGFVLFKDIADEDKLATLDKQGRLVYTRPVARQRFAHSGPMIRVRNPSLDLLVTPDHPVSLWRPNGEVATCRADELAQQPTRKHPYCWKRTTGWQGREQKQFVFPPRKGLRRAESVPMDEWLEFLGWFISEGSASRWITKQGGPTVSVDISQKKHPKIIARLQQFLRSWGFIATITARPNGLQVVRVTHSQLYDAVGPEHASQKYVPAYVKRLSRRQILIFLTALFDGDGSSTDGCWHFYTTTSKRLADDVQELLLKVGKAGTVHARKPVTGKQQTYDVSVSNVRRSKKFNPRQVSTESYDGYVYDVTMPGLPYILVRRNGRIVWGHNCETPADVMNFLSSQYGSVGLDELSTFELEQFLQISASARAPSDAPYQAVIRASSNPLGIGSDWMYDWFVDHKVRLEDYPDYNPADFEMQFSTLEDNTHLDRKAYAARLRNLPEHIRRAWLLGERVVEGAYFADFQPMRMEGASPEPWHVIEDLPTLRGQSIFDHNWLNVYRCIDWGYFPDPAVCLWVVVLPNKRTFFFKERTWRKTLAADVARQIVKASEGLKIVGTFCDPSMFIKHGETAFSIGEIFEQNGVPLTPSLNRRELFGYAIHDYLNTLISDGDRQYPKMQIVHEGCPNLIRTIPHLRMDPNDPQKIAEGEDHWAVAAAYYCMSDAMPSQDPVVSSTPRWMQAKRKPRYR